MSRGYPNASYVDDQEVKGSPFLMNGGIFIVFYWQSRS